VRGIGETTGAEYVVTDSMHFNQNATAGASTTTAGEAFHLIRRGSDDNYLFHAVSHTTVTPDGEVAVEFLHLLISCRG
jgi:hypothetical protein